MLWIGLTGGIGTGKTTAADILRQKQYSVIDADAIARDVVRPGAPGLKAVVDHFGGDLLTKSGELDRTQLARVVFSDPQKRTQLEKILHPIIQREVTRQKSEALAEGRELAFYDVPLLFESGLENQFDVIVVVYADEATQRQRLKQRNGWDDEQVSQRLASQIPITEKVKRADFVIENNQGLQQLSDNIEQMLHFIDRIKSSPKH